jgi:hypothetical protein
VQIPPVVVGYTHVRVSESVSVIFFGSVAVTEGQAASRIMALQ